jgi:hypothetical protein
VLVTDRREVLTLGAQSRAAADAPRATAATTGRTEDDAGRRRRAGAWPGRVGRRLLLAARRPAAGAARRGGPHAATYRRAARGPGRPQGALPRGGTGRDAGARARAAASTRVLVDRSGSQRLAPDIADAGRCWRSAATAAASCTPAPTSTSSCSCRRRSTPPGSARSSGWSRSCGTSASRSATACAPSPNARGERADVSVMTTLIEARLIAGSPRCTTRCARRSRRSTSGRSRISSRQGQGAGRAPPKANDTAYNLEPNVKTGPGGLRDIQTIGWVAKRHFGAKSLDELVDARVPDAVRTAQAEGRAVVPVEGALRPARADRPARGPPAVRPPDQARADLRLRGRLVHARGRAADAALLPHGDGRQPAERAAAAAVPRSDPVETRRRCRSTPRFQMRNDYLEAVSDDVFSRAPSALLELFVLLQQNPRSAACARRRSAHVAAPVADRRGVPPEPAQPPAVPRDPARARRRDARAAAHEHLRRARPLHPAFGRIVGRMQYDLFHAYTVDAHTLFVVSNLRRLAMPKFDHELPKLSRIMQSLPKPGVAYLAALFHDIAKGRGGDHSELGAVDAEAFCLEQGLSRYDARLVAWLVKNHLLLSMTAQKKDISRPEGHQRLRAARRRRDPPRLPLRADRSPTCAARTRSCGTPGRPRCSTSSTSASSARCAAGWRARSTRTS